MCEEHGVVDMALDGDGEVAVTEHETFEAWVAPYWSSMHQVAPAFLPDRQRLAVELYYFVGLPQDQTASVMGCAVGTVKSTLAATRHHLALI